MRPARSKYNIIFIRFLTLNKAIKIELTDTIFNEQFGSLSFFLHFISVQQYSTNTDLVFPGDGWITLDKEMSDNEELVASWKFTFVEFQDFLKFVKRRISYDIRCLKKFEVELVTNKATVTFIEDIARSWPDLFKRTQLRQLKRIYNQRIALAEFKTKTEPSKFHSLINVWEFIKTVGDSWIQKTRVNSFAASTIDDLWADIDEL